MASGFAETGGQILTFESDGNSFAFGILTVTDIIEIPEITPIPKTPEYIVGIMNLRGKAVPVMDLRLRLGFPKGEYDAKSCMIVTELNENQMGIIVDRVQDVENISAEEIIPSPVENGTVKYFVNKQDKRISLLDTEALIRKTIK